MSTQKLTWTLAIATYNRVDDLKKCIQCALNQTYATCQIVIIDGSPDWETYRQEVLDTFKGQCDVPIIYEPAQIKSTAAQRYQAVSQSTGDIVFLIDDDTLMYEDCAEKIMTIYNLDKDKQIAAVAGSNVNKNPLTVMPNEEIKHLSSSPGGGRIKHLFRKLLKTHIRFVPYDEDFPKHEIPEFLKSMHVAYCLTLPGFSMTMRQEIAFKEKHECRLLRYASDEDTDISYRASRWGLLIKAFDAKMHHIGSPGGRLSVFATSVLSSLNIIFLHKLHSTDLMRSRKRLVPFMRRRIMVEFAKDVYYHNFSFPRARGMLVGYRNLSALLKSDLQVAIDRFNQLQQRYSQ